MPRYYLYCVVLTRDFHLPAWQGIRLSAITQNDISLVISLSPPDQEITQNNFLTLHAELLDKLLSHYSLLPVRFGTLLESVEKGHELLSKNYHEFKRLLHRLNGRVEMGLKGIWNCESVSPIQPEGIKGKEYMLARLEEQKRQKKVHLAATALGEEINNSFKWAEDIKVKYMVTPKLFYNSSFLIKREEENRFWQCVEAVKTYHPDLKFMASGPWPAYNFASLATEEVTSCQRR